MAEIIDLDFYRKFKIILPMKQLSSRGKPYLVSRVPTRRYRRRQKSETESKITKKD